MTFKSVGSIIKENNMEKPEYWDELLHKYQTAYDVLMDYWDYFPDKIKPQIHKKLKELDL